jgi:hypothetical protein
MDVIFNCPECDQELAVDASGAGQEIECPNCKETITIPAASAPNTKTVPSVPGPAAANRPTPIASSAAAKVEMHLRVPERKGSERLIEKAATPLEFAAKETDRKIRVKTIRHTDCVEVGHDRFDEVVSTFLGKVGESNIINISPLNYSHLDIGTQKLLTDFGVLIVFKG